MKKLVNYSDLQSTSKQMLDDIYRISESLTTQFDTDKSSYTRQMNAFVSSAAERVRNVRDGIIAADMKLKEVQTFYGEGDGAGVGRGMQSQDFFGIFRTFTSSYKVGKGCLSILHRANTRCFFFFFHFFFLIVLPSSKSGQGRRTGGTGRSRATSCGTQSDGNHSPTYRHVERLVTGRFRRCHYQIAYAGYTAYPTRTTEKGGCTACESVVRVD